MARDLNRSIKIFIDNSDAMEKASKLEAKITDLRASMQKLAAEGKKNSDKYKSEEKALNKYERSLGNYNNKIKETERILKNLSGSTYKELKSTRSILRKELEKETRGTEQYTAKLKTLTAVQKELGIAQKEMTGRLGAQGTVMSRLTAGFNKYFGIATTFVAGITGISFTLRKLSQDAAEMDDTYSDVMKTTGLAKDEVLDLNESLKKMDTRTSREQLNLLARDAGKLNITTKKDIIEFVEAADQIQVALGEDLGEGAIREVGKMSDVFTRSTKEFEGLGLKEKMLAVGSAINEIGASSSANEQYLVQFTGRLGGVATQAGIGIDKIMGFASALDQDMQTVEMSATALQQLIMKIMGEPSKFAEIAGMEVSAFTDLLKNDANEAVLTVLRSLNEKGGFQELIPIFEGMKLSGTRTVGVLSSLAGSIDKVEEAQSLANKSMVEATSLTDEFNIKNNNAAAELEKRKKAFKDAAEDLGKRLNPALLRGTSLMSNMVRLLPSILDFFGKYGKYIFYLVTAYAAYNTGLKLATLWETKLKVALSLSNIQFRIQYGLMIAGRIAVAAYNIVVGLLTGNLTKVRAAWKALNAAMATNPIGLIAVAATAAVAGIVKLVQWLNRTTAATKAIREATKQYSNEEAIATLEAKRLFDALKETNPESETHLKIRKEIISKYGAYLKGLVDEKGNITDIGEAIEAVNNGLRAQIALKIRNQAAESIMTDSLGKQIDLTDKAIKRIGKQIDNEHILSGVRETINRTISNFTAEGSSDYAELQRKLLTEIQQTYGVDAYKGVFNVKNVVTDLVNEVQKSEKALAKVDDEFSGIISKYTDVSSVLQIEEEDNDDDDDVKPTVTTAEEDAKIYQEKLKKLEEYIAREKALIQDKYVNGEIALEEYHRQLEYLELERLRKNLELSGISFEQQKEIEFKIFETKKQMLDKIQDEERQHQAKLQKIQEDADKARAESNYNTLKAIAKQNEENYKIKFEAENKRKAELIGIGMDFSNDMGELLGNALLGNEDLVASSLKSIINMGLDLLKVQVQMAVAGATAQSLAQPDSVATFGASGLARAAILVGLIESAFAVVKTVVGGVVGKIGNKSSNTSSVTDSVTGSRVVTQRAKGKYDVIGADDRRLYRGIPYTGIASTGFVSTPTLMGEQGRELVVSAPDLSRLQRHINYPLVINAINDARSGIVPQRAKGNYSQISQPSQPSSPPTTSIDPELIAQLTNAINRLNNQGVQASVSLTELQSKQDLMNKSKNIGRK